MAEAKVIDISGWRTKRPKLANALAAIAAHPNLNHTDKAVAGALAYYSTDYGFFDLSQRERSSITRLGKFPLMSALKHIKNVGLLHKCGSGSLHCIGEKPSDKLVSAAQRLFSVRDGLLSLWFSLEDTDSRFYEVSWVLPKISRWCFSLTERELIGAIELLSSCQNMVFAEFKDGEAGLAVKFKPREYFPPPNKKMGASN